MCTSREQLYAKIEHFFTHGSSLLNRQQVANTIRGGALQVGYAVRDVNPVLITPLAPEDQP